ncbi:AEC family transporter [Acidicapsa ligni]|uniref:AEC family transporter n=1 Tax=Acidicapsa ligni TaxID=542300 RepID=UPI0021DF4B4F|nr:AEC family transporter [Acidicapsa ligni]
MNISRLFAALIPIFFVLILGYVAGRRHTFNSEQASGFSKLALGFALPATLFVNMTDIPKNLLLQQSGLVVALFISHIGLFLLALFAMEQIPSLKGTPAAIYALMLSSSAAPVFGIQVLRPLLGETSAGTVSLVALSIDFVIPLAIIFLEMNSAPGSSALNQDSPIAMGIKNGLKSPLLWAPVLGILSVLVGIHVPTEVSSSLSMIGSATAGVAVFTVGLILAAHAFRFSRAVVLGTIGRITIQTALLFALLRWMHISGPFAREALVCASFPMATVVVLFAAKYKTLEDETASILLLSTTSLFVTVPVTLFMSS